MTNQPNMETTTTEFNHNLSDWLFIENKTTGTRQSEVRRQEYSASSLFAEDQTGNPQQAEWCHVAHPTVDNSSVTAALHCREPVTWLSLKSCFPCIIKLGKACEQPDDRSLTGVQPFDQIQM